MLVEKLTTVCGSTIFVKVKMLRDFIQGQKRKKRKNPTAEKVAEVNQRLAEKELAMILNFNFKPGDLHLVLTYKHLPSNEEAHKALERFIKRCRAYMKRLGKEFKAVIATEYKHKRLHHHIVCSAAELEEIMKIWKQGHVKCSVLDMSGDYRRLAAYLIKETSKTFRDPDAFSKRRYNTTRNIQKPVTKSEKVSASMLLSNPKPIKGYYIDQDSVYKGENPFDEKPYVEYVMISEDAEAPRLVTWKRGKKARKENTYSKWLVKNLSKQIEIDISF
ncbi:hypothetical protein Ami103574_04370 [Aminipila butyrica]|uniref:Replication-associated protein ORF2/G2P domain-containing protein n=1 Tax=Aminipila butyrica TaxID=433296 RepID=A0A858BTC2_9FIRM|nr:hypothetical protein [Aminipila butyrica]QIB68602.1 hypothetical protein Ami103574_04370 [Aminipila butyrica]